MTNRRRLNFIFSQPDETPAESSACYGRPLIGTPNHDRLAAEGVRFDQSHVQNAQRSPSRVSMQDDPRETRNLIGDPDVQTAKAELKLDRSMRTSDTVPVGGDPGRLPFTRDRDGRPVTGEHALA